MCRMLYSFVEVPHKSQESETINCFFNGLEKMLFGTDCPGNDTYLKLYGWRITAIVDEIFKIPF